MRRRRGFARLIPLCQSRCTGNTLTFADEIVRSAEVDLISKRDPKRAEWLDAIGQDSPFHRQFGYYADPVDESTATLPKGGKGRLVNLPPGDTDGVTGLCLKPHDLAIAKYVAGPRQGSNLHA
jgi:hypothetical protein